jgi:hypothetical protein
MNSFLRFLLAGLTLGAGMIGCGRAKPPEPARPADVVLSVPGMH